MENPLWRPLKGKSRKKNNNLEANSHPGEKQLCQVVEQSVKYFSSYAHPKN